MLIAVGNHTISVWKWEVQLEVKSEVNKGNMEIHIQELGWKQWVEKNHPKQS